MKIQFVRNDTKEYEFVFNFKISYQFLNYDTSAIACARGDPEISRQIKYFKQQYLCTVRPCPDCSVTQECVDAKLQWSPSIVCS